VIYVRPTFHLYQMLLEYARRQKPPKFVDDGEPLRHVPILGQYCSDSNNTTAKMRHRFWLSDYYTT
jgi:hypothetical protein